MGCRMGNRTMGQALRTRTSNRRPSMRAKSPTVQPGRGGPGPRTGRLSKVHITDPTTKRRPVACHRGRAPCAGFVKVSVGYAGGCVDPRYNRRRSAFDSCQWRYTREHPTPTYPADHPWSKGGSLACPEGCASRHCTPGPARAHLPRGLPEDCMSVSHCMFVELLGKKQVRLPLLALISPYHLRRAKTG